MQAVPYFLDLNLQPHALTLEQLQACSAADLEFHLAASTQAVGSLKVCMFACMCACLHKVCLCTLKVQASLPHDGSMPIQKGKFIVHAGHNTTFGKHVG